jgi:hypothetical protein
MTRLVRTIELTRELGVRARRAAAIRKNSKLHGQGVRDIPIFSFPEHDVPRLDQKTGFTKINRITNPVLLR